MKVFISHCSLDQWIARMIARDLEARNITTFLDEKDIETGESIDDSIQQHLHDCDELLMLLSPAALDSHWVLIEVGGAKALNKRLIPILIHVGPNDLPQPLAKGLARDLNEIEKYLDEVQERSESRQGSEVSRGATPIPVGGPRGDFDENHLLDFTDDFDLGNLDVANEDETRAARSAEALAEAAGRVRRTFVVGDVVRIPEQPQRDFILDSGMAIRWTSDMTAHAGKTAMVTRADPDRTVRLDVDRAKWWAMDWLDPATN